MRRLFQFTVVACLLGAAGLAIAAMRREVVPAGVPLDPVLSVSDAGATASATVDADGRFALDQVRRVVLDADQLTAARLTERERRDQFLDWMLIAVAADIEPNPEALNRLLQDQPLLRHGYVKPLGVLEFGVTRSRFVKDGVIAALIPADATAAERKDQIAHIADEHRKNLGGAFEVIRPYEYRLNAMTGEAGIVRRPDISYSTTMSAEYGYRGVTVTDRAGLAEFLAQADDLTHIKIVSNGVELGGRKILSQDYRGITIEHVATIWQAQKKIREHEATLQAYSERLVDAHNATWAHRSRYPLGDYPSPLQFDPLKGDWGKTPEESAWEKVQADIAAEARRMKFVGSIGFSLDPDYDYKGLAAQWPVLARMIGVNAEDSAEILDALKRADIIPLLKYEDGLSKSLRLESKSRADYLSEFARTFRYQAARYDGDLSGTEVGMILYYTDLLAKLWVLDYHDSAPAKLVRGFMSGISVPLSASYMSETDLYPSARLWFGSSDLGYQRLDGEMLFRRLATRIYSAGSNPLEPGKEVKTSVALGAPIDWWNDHYEEVSWVEPQYQRLNQIMKWSAALGWVLAQPGETSLGFLADEPVSRRHWFPEWARQQPDLFFKAWDAIPFMPKGALGSTTEALPMLNSRSHLVFGVGRFLSGGVSLARPQEIVKRPLIPRQFPKALRRSNLDYASSGASGTIKTLDGVTYETVNVVNGALTKIKAAADTQLRGTYAQLRNGTFERDVIRADGGLQMTLRLDGESLGRLGIEPAGNGFKIAWQARDIEADIGLARRLSTKSDIPAELRARGDVELAYAVPDKPQYLVKQAGNRGWTLLTVEQRSAPTIAGDAHARAGEANAGVSIEVEVLKADAAEALIAGARPIKAEGAFTTKASLQLDGHIAGHNLRDAADTLSRMPGKDASKLLADRLRRDLTIVDALIKDGNNARAIGRIDQLIGTYGPLPEFSLRKAMLLLEGKQTELAANAMQRMTPVQLRDQRAFLNEVAARLKQAHLPAAARRDFETIGDIAVLHQRVAARPLRDLGQAPEIRPFVGTDGRLEIGYRVSPGLQASTKPAGSLPREAGQATVYVEDNAAFSHVDWSLPLHDAMKQTVSGAKVLKYSDESLAGLRPAKLYSADGQTAFNRVGESSHSYSGQGAAQGARAAGQSNSPSCPAGTHPAANNSCQADVTSQEFYVVSLKAAL